MARAAGIRVRLVRIGRERVSAHRDSLAIRYLQSRRRLTVYESGADSGANVFVPSRVLFYLDDWGGRVDFEVYESD